MSSDVKRCAACRTEKPVSEMKVCMHAEMHNYVCDSKCMNDFYNPPKVPTDKERIAALEAECERLREALDRQSVITGDYIARCQRLADELAITRRVIDRIGQLCTTQHESRERFIRRVQSVIEWERAAQQDQPQ